MLWASTSMEALTQSSSSTTKTQEQRVRARMLGLALGEYPTGKHNAITDVPGVRVGHTTLIRGEGRLMPGQGPVRTGVTVIIPRDDVWHSKSWKRTYGGHVAMSPNGQTLRFRSCCQSRERAAVRKAVA